MHHQPAAHILLFDIRKDKIFRFFIITFQMLICCFFPELMNQPKQYDAVVRRNFSWYRIMNYSVYHIHVIFKDYTIWKLNIWLSFTVMHALVCIINMVALCLMCDTNSRHLIIVIFSCLCGMINFPYDFVYPCNFAQNMTHVVNRPTFESRKAYPYRAAMGKP